jgi:hypothetical protein
MRRLLVAAIIAATVLLPQPGTAGGSWLETPRRYLVVGEEVTARGTFGPGTNEGEVSDGPFHAYLLPGNRWLDAGPIPPEAVPIGPMSITAAEGSVCCWLGTVTFTVPDVPPGRYTISYCNDPCTVNGIGDLIGGSVQIATTREEARLGAEVDRLREQIGILRARADRGQSLEAALEATREARDRLRERIEALRDAPAPVTEPGADDRSSFPWWAGVLMAAVAFLAGAVLARRRRRERGLVPDFVPDHLRTEAGLGDQVPSMHPTTSRGRPGMSSPSPPSTKS